MSNKKKKEKIKNLIKKEIEEYDENYFSFSLTGGPIHSELLVANGRVKVGNFLNKRKNIIFLF